MSTWQLQEAKARLSEVIQSAQTEGPQIITRRGEKTAVVLNMEDWQRMEEWRRINPPASIQPPQKRLTNAELLAFLQSAPDFEIPDRHAERLKKRRKRSA